MNYVDKYYWVYNHPSLRSRYFLYPEIDVYPVTVCPDTNEIAKDESLNTKPKIWVEVTVANKKCDQKIYKSYHDYDLDCTGDTYEEAINILYELVLNGYGDYSKEDLDSFYKSISVPEDFDL